ncbi:MAG: LacI family DNA-binding transcriptional regulator [Bifidobacterium bifidum]
MTHPAQRDAFETPHPQRQRAARFDVARPAGVSTAVVSYVLNGSPKKISPDTAQRVFDAAQWLDYHPNSVARALKTGTTHTLGIIVPDFSNPYFAEFTDQLEAAASKRERALIINLPRGDPQGERRRINELVERNIDAMFVSSAQTDAELGALRGQRGARPRAHARHAAHRRRTRHQAVLRMQVTGRQVAANGSQ